MNKDNGYIYIRYNEVYGDNCKIGKTIDICNRDNQYATYEINRGYFEAVYKVSIKNLNNIEKSIHRKFNNLNIRNDAGIEFFNRQIINFIEPYLITLGIRYTKLTKKEIAELIKLYRAKELEKSRNNELLIKKVYYKPRDYQEIIIQKSYNYFQTNKKGVLVIPCGVGKTLISLWITERTNSNTILIGVPNKLLLKQWNKVINELFRSIKCFTVSSGIKVNNIVEFLESNKEKCIIISTYASSYKVYEATNNISFIFDMKINDECHHLTSTNIKLLNSNKKFIQILNIKSNKQLSLTATIKYLEPIEKDTVISNDSKKYFGELIDRKCLLWSIKKNIICDYIIQSIITDKKQLDKHLLKFNINEENNKRLFLSAYTSLKSIFTNDSHHILIYSNNQENSEKIIQYIRMLLEDQYFDIYDLYYSIYHSKMNSKCQKNILKYYDKAKNGIISCVYCLGEGYDNHSIDGVVFAENMNSNIRIVQSALRASRKNSLEPNKITKIILPILNKIDWINNTNPDLKKVIEIIYQMSMEDKTIIDKIKVLNINITKERKEYNISSELKLDILKLGEYNDELTKQLILNSIKRSQLDITYETARKIIVDKNIKNKESYYELCKRDNRLSKEPEIIFKNQFKNWIEYLSIERLYYDFETCKNKIDEYLLLYPELKKIFELSKISKKLCEIDKMFPPFGLWTDYYNVKNLQYIIILKKKKNIKNYVL